MSLQQGYERASLMNVRHVDRQHQEQKREHSQNHRDKHQQQGQEQGREQGQEQGQEHKHLHQDKHHHHHHHHHHQYQVTTPDKYNLNYPAPRVHTPPSHKLAIHTHAFRSRPKRTIMILMGQLSASPSLVKPPRKIDQPRQQITPTLVLITSKPQVSQPTLWLPMMPRLTAKRNWSAKRGSVLPVTQVRVIASAKNSHRGGGV
ncbi:hypothetical protein B484DRAFT_96111 [Ochromonadaceae sp. CCMP2298]|nr:hypothetical protein B484DRAFT_96111 [Ochromonadaceae sp. CCMP2298]